jgi:hypothetical protein
MRAVNHQSETPCNAAAHLWQCKRRKLCSCVIKVQTLSIPQDIVSKERAKYQVPARKKERNEKNPAHYLAAQSLMKSKTS